MSNIPNKKGSVSYFVGIKNALSDIGLWFIFGLIIYLIILVKVNSNMSLGVSLFFNIYSLTITIYIFSRFILSYFHKSIPINESYEPTIAFVVPAFNEGDNIAQTMAKFAEVNYPKEKIEVITINDGSTDNTLEEMLRMQKELQKKIGSVKVINWEVNRGKRHGMATGVTEATSEIIIFIDSDSFIDKDCVKHLVKYFSIPKIGAVSGHTEVYNRDTNLLTQMQSVRYYIAFRVYKAAESVFGVVTCCPGCCSAYRRSYLMEFLPEWLNQKFLGTQCTFGDDRSLTNFIIKKYSAAYSAEAMAYTVVPDKFNKYLKQQQRWKKSWIRETFIASSFIWKKNPIAAIFFYTYVFLALSSPFVFIRALIWRPIIFHTLPLAYLIGLFLMLLLHGLYYRIQVGNKAWVLAIVSFWFNTVILMWQLPWAFITISDTRWGTR